MDVIDIQLIHGRNKYQISISATASLAELMAKAEEITGIPASGMKLIHQAKTLTAFPHSTTLVNCNLINGSKVMVLAWVYAPKGSTMGPKLVPMFKNAKSSFQNKSRKIDPEKDEACVYAPKATMGPKLVPMFKNAKSSFQNKGRKIDPEKDEAYQRIVVIDKKIMETAQRFIELSVQVHDIENGHLAKEHQETALRDLEKRCKGCSEQWMRALESLDGIQLQEDQTMAKSKRKSVVNAANSHMDQAEEMLQRITKLKAKV